MVVDEPDLLRGILRASEWRNLPRCCSSSACIRIARGCVYPHMIGLLILLAVLATPYIALNVRRLIQGRSWAFTFCQAAKEWEEGERARRLAARAAGMQPPARGGSAP